MTVDEISLTGAEMRVRVDKDQGVHAMGLAIAPAPAFCARCSPRPPRRRGRSIREANPRRRF